MEYPLKLFIIFSKHFAMQNSDHEIEFLPQKLQKELESEIYQHKMFWMI